MIIQLIGRYFFGIGMIYLAMLGFLVNDFIIGRLPVANSIQILNYILGAGIIINAVLVLINSRYAGIAALTTGLIILIYSFIAHHIPFFISAPNFEAILWNINAFKSLALFGGSLIISASLFEANKSQISSILKKYNAIFYFKIMGIITLSIFLMISGFAHFKFFDFLKGFMPAYIPFHAFFIQFTGICLVSGGAGLLIPATRELAALLLGIMLFSWFLLLHIPRFLADINALNDRMGLGESLIFVGVFFVLYSLVGKKQGSVN
jgi:uncharacterized membrane protein YphA (DoxX/SURF4 family)